MIYYKISIIIYFFTGLVQSQIDNSTIAEFNLTDWLFNSKSYTKKLSPSASTIIINVAFSEFQLVGIDEKNQIMTSIVNMIQVWSDPRLKWNKTLYNNISKISVPSEDVWKPNTIFKNSATGDGFLPLNKEYSYVSIFSGGIVIMQTQVMSLQTRCELNMQKYPFDNQTCFITLQAWPALEDNKTFYSLYNQNTNLRLTKSHQIWDVTSAIQEPISNSRFNITLSIKRKPNFYILNTIIPCDILNILILFAFFIPFANQMALGNFFKLNST
jgi:hypothetical protein